MLLKNKNNIDADLFSMSLKSDMYLGQLTDKGLRAIILKIIFAKADVEVVNSSFIKKQLKELLGTNVDKEKIESTINELLDKNTITKNEEKLRLSNETKNEIDQQLNSYRTRTEEILTKYFLKLPIQLPKKTLKKWFLELSNNIFKTYYEELLELEFQTKDFPDNSEHSLEQIIDDSFNFSVSDEHKKYLKNKYLEFFKSQDISEKTFLFNLGVSFFSLLLIKPSSSVENFKLDYFRDACFFLDTNILMYLRIKSYNYYDHFEAIEHIFKRLNIKLFFFGVTENEYTNTLKKKQKQILDIKDFINGSEKLNKRVNDYHWKEINDRNYKSNTDIENFFKEIEEVPDVFFNKIAIKRFREEDYAIDEIIVQGMEDEDKVNLLKKFKIDLKNNDDTNKKVTKSNSKTFKTSRNSEEDIDDLIDFSNSDYFNNDSELESLSNNAKDYNFDKSSLSRDIGVLEGIKYLNENNTKAFFLTRDEKLVKFVDKDKFNNIGYDPRQIVSFKFFIKFLSINANSFLDENEQNDFAGAHMNMILHELMPKENTYTTSELLRVFSTHKKIKDLPVEKKETCIPEIIEMSRQKEGILTEKDIAIAIEEKLGNIYYDMNRENKKTNQLNEKIQKELKEKEEKNKQLLKQLEQEQESRKQDKIAQYTKEIEDENKSNKIKKWVAIVIDIFLVLVILILCVYYIDKIMELDSVVEYSALLAIVSAIIAVIYKVARYAIKFSNKIIKHPEAAARERYKKENS